MLMISTFSCTEEVTYRLPVFCCCRHRYRVLTVLLLSSSSPPCPVGPAAIIIVTVSPSRSWRHRPAVARHRLRCHRWDVTLLTSRVVAFLPHVTTAIVTFVLTTTSSRRRRLIRHRLSAVVTSSPLLERFIDLKYYIYRDTNDLRFWIYSNCAGLWRDNVKYCCIQSVPLCVSQLFFLSPLQSFRINKITKIEIQLIV